MPTYEYECTSCSKTFEVFQSMNEKPLTKCPDCGKKVRRLIGTGSGIIFKGSGFHETDYRSKEYRDRTKNEKCSACPAKKEGSCPATKKSSTSD